VITSDIVRKLALAFDEAIESPHFELTSFRVRKKIFATMDEKKNRVCLMLKPVEQSVFCAYDKSIMYPVPNSWGKKGATYVEIKKVKKDMFIDALTEAYCAVAPEKLAHKYKQDQL
jgi:hypothetical protein